MLMKAVRFRRTLTRLEDKPGFLKTRPAMRAILGGALGALAMAVVFYLAPTLGLPRLSIFGTMSTVSSQDFAWMAPLQYLGLSIIVFPLLYGALVYENLSGSPWSRGLKWGLLLWLLRALVVMPVMGEGLFSEGVPNPIGVNIVTLLGHAIYGLLLGGVAGDQIQYRHRYITHRRFHHHTQR